MSFRTSFKLLFVCSFVLCAAAAMAQAPASIFQLDGNAGLDAGYPGCLYTTCDYWNLLNGAGGAGTITQTQTPPTASGNWSARTFINGTASTSSFTGGGSKDSNLISQWSWSGSPTPNKDTLNAGYAAGLTWETSTSYLVQTVPRRAATPISESGSSSRPLHR